MGAEYFIDKDFGVMRDRRVAVLLGEAVGLPRGNTRKKCTLTPFFSVREMYSDPIFWGV